MAVVATAASAPAILASDRRLSASFRWLVALAGMTVALELMVQSVAHAVLPAGWQSETLLLVSVLGFVLTLGAAALAWLVHRHAMGLLLLATLVPIVYALWLIVPWL